MNTIRPILNDKEDGGLLPAWQKRPQRWLRCVPRLKNMIVTPQCNECRHDTKPTDTDLKIRVDYVNYGALRKKWKRAEANELRKLCNEEGIVVEAGLSAAASTRKAG